MFVAFAGNVGLAHTALQRLRDNFREYTPDEDYLRTVLKGSFADILTPEVSLMIVMRHEGKVSFVPINCRTVRLPGIGKVWVAGSGIDQLQRMAEALEAPLRDCLSYQNKLHGLLACALFIAGCMLGNEVWSAGTLLDSFGGFYEIAECTGSTFRYFTDYVYVFWEFPVNNDAPPAAMKVMKRLQRQDPSEYFSIDLPLGEAGAVSNERRYQVATGLNGPAAPPPADPVDLNATFQVNVLGLNVGTKSFGTTARIHHAENPTDHVIFFTRSGTTLTRQIRLHYLREYCDGILPLARRVAGQSPFYILSWPPQ